jgi:hypothetical protein
MDAHFVCLFFVCTVFSSTFADNFPPGFVIRDKHMSEICLKPIPLAGPGRLCKIEEVGAKDCIEFRLIDIFVASD